MCDRHASLAAESWQLLTMCTLVLLRAHQDTLLESTRRTVNACLCSPIVREKIAVQAAFLGASQNSDRGVRSVAETWMDGRHTGYSKLSRSGPPRASLNHIFIAPTSKRGHHAYHVAKALHYSAAMSPRIRLQAQPSQLNIPGAHHSHHRQPATTHRP